MVNVQYSRIDRAAEALRVMGSSVRKHFLLRCGMSVGWHVNGRVLVTHKWGAQWGVACQGRRVTVRVGVTHQWGAQGGGTLVEWHVRKGGTSVETVADPGGPWAGPPCPQDFFYVM